MRLLAIDPGPGESACVDYDCGTGIPISWFKVDNETMRNVLLVSTCDHLAIESVASYGMAVGADVFETCVWVGRFVERWLGVRGIGAEAFPPPRSEPVRVYRRECKLHLCGSQRAKDSNIRQALIDRYGPGKEKAIGLKRSPGPLYGMSGDCWAALAVAVTAAETRLSGQEAA